MEGLAILSRVSDRLKVEVKELNEKQEGVVDLSSRTREAAVQTDAWLENILSSFTTDQVSCRNVE